MSALDNVERAKRPSDLTNLLGTYCWELYQSSSGENYLDYWDEGQRRLDVLTLSLKEGTRVAKPQNVVGEFKLGYMRGKFEGLRPVEGNDSAGTWDVCNTVWEDRFESEVHRLWISKELDDNGHPFLGMYTDTGGCHGAEAIWNLAKKQKDYVDGVGWKSERFSEAERKRLHLHLGGASPSDEASTDDEGDDEVDTDDLGPETDMGGSNSFEVQGNSPIPDAGAPVEVEREDDKKNMKHQIKIEGIGVVKEEEKKSGLKQEDDSNSTGNLDVKLISEAEHADEEPTEKSHIKIANSSTVKGEENKSGVANQNDDRKHVLSGVSAMKAESVKPGDQHLDLWASGNLKLGLEDKDLHVGDKRKAPDSDATLAEATKTKRGKF